MLAPLSITLDRLGSQHPGILLDMRRGIEKEGLRVDTQARISAQDHPKLLGHPLTHPYITTDYSEALPELITPVCSTREELFDWLQAIHQTLHEGLPQGEVLWPASMPCGLAGEESIRIARYGPSLLGQLKHVYRRGLALRYGRTMQSIAGVHYNWSLGPDFWRAFESSLALSNEEEPAATQGYFALIRNFRRWSWLLMYLFGASPLVHESFFDGRPIPASLRKMAAQTWVKDDATSLRMGDLGYHNDAQAELFICFNALETYIDTLEAATRTEYPDYAAMGVLDDAGQYQQLNGNLLQIANEYYNSIRPKRVAESGESPLEALRRGGVEYIEVRCLDINPFEPLGLSPAQCDFLDVFLLTCLLSPAHSLGAAECRQCEENFNRVVMSGRDPDLMLHSGENARIRPLGDWAMELFDALLLTAHHLDRTLAQPHYQQVISEMQRALKDPERLLSQRLQGAVQTHGGGWLQWGLDQGLAHQSTLRDMPAAAISADLFAKAALQSKRDEEALRAREQGGFSEYLQAYLAP